MDRRVLIRVVPILIAVVIAAVSFFSAEKFTNEAGRQTRVSLTSEEEAKLGLQNYQQVLTKYQTVESGPEFQMVRRVADRVQRGVGKSGQGFQWAVTLVKEDQANAFCLPGGKIVVFTGILPYTKTEAGLAAVMGHEIAHATARHGNERLTQQKVMNTVMTGVAVSLSEMDAGKQQQVMALLGAGAQYGIILPWGRDQESEADHLGLLYMARAGYDPHEAITFWERMAQAGGGKNPPEFLSTHPSNETRIAGIKKYLPEAMADFEKASTAGLR